MATDEGFSGLTGIGGIFRGFLSAVFSNPTPFPGELTAVRRAERALLVARGEEGERFTDADIIAGIDLAERNLEEARAQEANVRALRPAAQLTREPVPVAVLPPTPIPPEELFGPPRPAETVEIPDSDELLRIASMAFGFSDISSALGELSGLVGNVRGLLSQPGTMAAVPTAFVAGPAARAIIGGAAGAGIFEGATRFLGGRGGNGAPTALQRIKADAGRNVTRRQVIRMARVCGLETTAQMLSTSTTNVCEVVSKGMPRRSRGISSRDMTRTRSTLSKLNTMQRSLGSLCPTPRRRAPSRRTCK